jgi:uncharacterized protein with PIN domain/prolyl-tRNA editing enzyme YbaK/EbsC (Cys-tRNA(Pro) deacylase)
VSAEPSPARFTIASLELVARRAAAAGSSSGSSADGSGCADNPASAVAAAAATSSSPGAPLSPLFHLLLEALASIEPWARADAAGAPATSPSPLDARRCGASASAAAALLSSALSRPPRGAGAGLDARAALRLAQTFRLRSADLEAHSLADAARYTHALFAAGQHAPAVLLSLQLQLLALPPAGAERIRGSEEAEEDMLSSSSLSIVASPASFPALLSAGQEALAESLAASLGGDAPSELVRAALRAQRYRCAAGAARRFRLEEAFPQAAALHTAHTLSRLVERGLWDAAAALAGADGAHRRSLVMSAAAAGEHGVALDLVLRFGAPTQHQNSTNKVATNARACAPARAGLEAEFDAAALEAAATQAAVLDADTYLPLGVPPERVHWVSDAAALPAMAAALAAAPAIGLDAEWRAITAPRATARQRRVGSNGSAKNGGALEPLGLPRRGEEVEPLIPSAAAAEDLDAGADDVDGDDDDNDERMVPGRVALLQLATAHDVFLLDLPALAAACPDALSDALAPALCSADVPKLGYGVAADLVKAAQGAPRVAALAAARGMLDLRDAWRAARREEPPAGGLAGASAVALGKPLDKRPRMSDWERRPLTAAQARYAANDAHVALRIYDALTGSSSSGGDASGGGGGGGGAAVTVHVEELPPLGPPNVAAALAATSACWHMVRTDEEGATSAAAAAALRVSITRIVKSLGIIVDATATAGAASASPQSLLLLLLRGDQRADLAAVARAAGVPRRAVRFATAAECVQRFGYAPGSMPPLGHRGACDVFIDEALLRGEGLSAEEEEDAEAPCYAGGGAREWHVAMPRAALAAAAGARAVRIATARAVTPAEPATAATASDGGVAFVVDSALARLGRWLRCLGCDVTYVPTLRGGAHAAQLDTLTGSSSGSSSIDAAVPPAPHRVLLTRDPRVLLRRDCGAAFLVPSDDPRQQLAAVRAHFGLAFEPGRLLSRCAACNGVVGTRRAAADVAADAALPGCVRDSADATEVWACNACGKSFWVGPKSRRAVEFMASLRASSVFGHPLDGGADADADADALDEAPSPSSQLAAQIQDVMAASAASAAKGGAVDAPDSGAALAPC